MLIENNLSKHLPGNAGKCNKKTTEIKNKKMK
jgi:hypothetical protein